MFEPRTAHRKSLLDGFLPSSRLEHTHPADVHARSAHHWAPNSAPRKSASSRSQVSRFRCHRLRVDLERERCRLVAHLRHHVRGRRPRLVQQRRERAAEPVVRHVDDRRQARGGALLVRSV